jgi:Uma2 family endonuclease
MAHMTTTLTTSGSDQTVLLHNISWELYESLLAAHEECPVPRFTYDRGCLEIMSPSLEHETLKAAIALLVNLAAEEKRINLFGCASTTFRRRDLAKGFEPDTCFYGKNRHRIQGKRKVDLRMDPPPDLVIEIDITSPSMSKLPIMAAIGVPELWLYDSSGWRIFTLRRAKYTEQAESSILPGLRTELITILIEERPTLEPLDWMRRVRELVRST